MERSAVILVVLVVLALLAIWFVWRGRTEAYMTGYYIFPQGSSHGYTPDASPYPLSQTPCGGPKTTRSHKETMYRWPLDNPRLAAKYGDRRPLCLKKGSERHIPFDTRNQYYGGEFGWNHSFYY